MKVQLLEFDEDLSQEVLIECQKHSIILELGDDLEACQETLSEHYKQEITDFLNASKVWYKLAEQRIEKETKDLKGLMLTTIFILSEQNENPLTFGLSFNLDYDREHGRGMKMLSDSYAIIEYGEADIGFS